MRERYLDGIKGVACICVYLAHLYATFYSFCTDKPELSSVIVLFNDWFKIFFDGGFAVMIFCVISGYLTASKQISTLKELFFLCIRRYFRFFIPFLITDLLICLMYYTIGFYTQEVAAILQNSWLGFYYSTYITPWRCLKNCILLGAGFNGPLWVMFPLYIGSCAVMIYNYVLKKNNNKVVIFLWDMLFIGCVWLISKWWSIGYITFATCVGLVLRLVIEKVKCNKEWIGTLLFFIAFLMIDGLQNVLATRIGNPFRGVSLQWQMFWACCMVWGAYNSKIIKRFYESRLAQTFGKISFGVFMVHFPILCSVSLIAFLKYYGKVEYTILYLSIFLATTVFVLIISIVYRYTIERFGAWLLNRIIEESTYE